MTLMAQRDLFGCEDAVTGPKAERVTFPSMREVLAMRGAVLAEHAREIERRRKAGEMCWRCTRVLAAGARCPIHPNARPTVPLWRPL